MEERKRRSQQRRAEGKDGGMEFSKRMEWRSAAQRGLRPITHNNETRRATPIHSFNWFGGVPFSRHQLIPFIHLPRYRLEPRSLFSLLVRFVFSSISSKWKKDSRSSKKKNNSLSLLLSLIGIESLFCCSLPLAEPLAVPPPITHQRKNKQTLFIPSNSGCLHQKHS